MKLLLGLLLSTFAFNSFAFCGRSDFILRIDFSSELQSELDANQDTPVPFTLLGDGVSIINIDNLSSRHLYMGQAQYDGAGNYIIEAKDNWGAQIYIAYEDETAASEGLVGTYTDEFGVETDLSQFKCSYNDLF